MRRTKMASRGGRVEGGHNATCCSAGERFELTSDSWKGGGEVKPAPFAYLRVKDVAEAVAALQRYGSDARILAGGQSLILTMNMRRVRPGYLIDINPIAELDYIRQRDGGLAIGALTRHRTVERSELVARLNPLLVDAVKRIAHFQVRNRGTIGGSLANSDPHAEYPVALRLLDAELVATGPRGERIISAETFFKGPFQTDLAIDEVLTEVRVPRLPAGAGYGFDELSRRENDPPILCAAALVSLSGEGTVTEARLALGNLGGKTPYRVQAVDRLVGTTPSEDALQGVAQGVMEEVEPDPEGSLTVSYKKHLAATLSVRTLQQARERARGGV